MEIKNYSHKETITFLRGEDFSERKTDLRRMLLIERLLELHELDIEQEIKKRRKVVDKNVVLEAKISMLEYVHQEDLNTIKKYKKEIERLCLKYNEKNIFLSGT